MYKLQNFVASGGEIGDRMPLYISSPSSSKHVGEPSVKLRKTVTEGYGCTVSA